MIQLHLAYWIMVAEFWSVIAAVDTPPAKPPCVVLDFVEFKRSKKTVLPKYILR